jgi:archaellin
MTKLSFFLALPDSYSFITVAFIAIAALAAGVLIKFGILAKARSRVLRLENEMLSNHARILKLEKKLTDLQAENSKLGGDMQGKKISGLERKIS